jgi:hypothetical protein
VESQSPKVDLYAQLASRKLPVATGSRGSIAAARAHLARIQIADIHWPGGAGVPTDAGTSPLVRTIMREAR